MEQYLRVIRRMPGNSSHVVSCFARANLDLARHLNTERSVFNLSADSWKKISKAIAGRMVQMSAFCRVLLGSVAIRSDALQVSSKFKLVSRYLVPYHAHGHWAVLEFSPYPSDPVVKLWDSITFGSLPYMLGHSGKAGSAVLEVSTFCSYPWSPFHVLRGLVYRWNWRHWQT